MEQALIEWLNTVSTYWAASMLRGSIDGGLVVAAVWSVCKLFKRTPPAVRYWLWWLACAKFLLAAVVLPAISIPVLPASIKRPSAIVRLISQPRLTGPMSTMAGHAHMSLAHAVAGSQLTAPTSDGARQASNDHTPAASHVPTPISAALPAISIVSIVMLLWIAIVSAIAFVTARRAVSMAGIVRRGRKVSLGDIVDTQIVCRLRVIVSDEASGLCVTGLFRPVLLVPSTWPLSLSDVEKRMAIAHEIAHLRRGDLWLGLVPTIASALFFFFPLTRLAAHGCAQACEEACDVAALRSAGCSLADYAGMLVKSATPRSVATGALGVSPAYRQLRGRLEGLAASSHSPSAILKLLAAAIVTAVLVALAPWRLAAKATPAAPPPSTPRSPFRYELVDLGPISGDDASHFQINGLGQIIGTSNGRPFLWHDGKVDRLSTLWYHNGRGGGIGNTGVYAVTCYSDAGYPHAFWFRSGIHLMKGLPGYRFTVARGVGDNGWIVGTAQHSGSDPMGAEIARAVLWIDGRARDLGTLGGLHSAAYAVNSDGQIVGKADLPSNAAGSRPTHAFLWQDGVMHDLGTLGGSDSFAYAVNDRGDAAGFSQITGDSARHACLWHDGTPVDLGVLPGDSTSEAHGINSRGEVVGTSDSVPNAGDNRAVLWQDGTAVDGSQAFAPSRGVDLNKAVRNRGDWHLDDAMAINDSGFIVGKGRVDGSQAFAPSRGVDGAMHAFVLTPIASTTDKSGRGMGVPPVRSSEG